MKIEDARFFTTNILTNGAQTQLVSTGKWSESCFILQGFNQQADDDGRIPNSATVIDLADLTGTVLIEVSEDGVNWGAVNDGSITLGSASGYVRPTLTLCPWKYMRVTLTSIVAGATGLQSLRVTAQQA